LGGDHTSGLDGTLLVIGFVIALVGAILMLVAVIPLGRLPGDIRIESEQPASTSQS
jgi:flagellin-like protein